MMTILNSEKKIMLDKFTFNQVPVSLDISSYDKAREWIVNFFSSISDVVAVYEYGSVNNPGISDLDLMVVLKDYPKVKDIKDKIKFREIPRDLITLINNRTVKFISRKHFKDINLLGEFKEKFLYGENIKLNNPSMDYFNLFRIASVMDFLPERVLTLLEFRENKMIPLVYVIGLLKSYLYSVKTTEHILEKHVREIAKFEKEMNDFRESWFQRSFSGQTKALLILIDRGISLGLKIIKELSIFLVSKEYYLPRECAKKAAFYFNAKKGFRFYTDDRNVDMDINKYFCLDRRKGILLLVPSIWFGHFYFYGQQRGIISSLICNNFLPRERVEEFGISPEISKVLFQRIALCNEMAEFFKKYNIPMNKLHRFAHIQNI